MYNYEFQTILSKTLNFFAPVDRDIKHLLKQEYF